MKIWLGLLVFLLLLNTASADMSTAEKEELFFGSKRYKITGTFLDFQHHSTVEGVYWNPQAAMFTDQMWEQKIEEMAEIGMKYVVVMAVALYNKSFYPSEILPKYPIKAHDPVEAVLKAAAKNDIKVFLGAGFYGDWTNPWQAFTDRKVRERTKRAVKELSERYGHYESFYGFYWPNEVGIDRYFPQAFIDHVKENNSWAREYLPRAKILIAPYGTNRVKADAYYIEQLKDLGVDIIAYQDEVGVEKTKFDDLSYVFENLKRAHELAGVTLWADMEIFRFEGRVYNSALLPADLNRIRMQLKGIGPYVEEILCYQYIGLMDKPESEAQLGPREAQKLYEDYYNYLQGLPTIKP